MYTVGCAWNNLYKLYQNNKHHVCEIPTVVCAHLTIALGSSGNALMMLFHFHSVLKQIVACFPEELQLIDPLQMLLEMELSIGAQSTDSMLPASVSLGYLLKLTLLALNGVLERATARDNIQGLKVCWFFLSATICSLLLQMSVLWHKAVTGSRHDFLLLIDNKGISVPLSFMQLIAILFLVTVSTKYYQLMLYLSRDHGSFKLLWPKILESGCRSSRCWLFVFILWHLMHCLVISKHLYFCCIQTGFKTIIHIRFFDIGDLVAIPGSVVCPNFLLPCWLLHCGYFVVVYALPLLFISWPPASIQFINGSCPCQWLLSDFAFTCYEKQMDSCIIENYVTSHPFLPVW